LAVLITAQFYTPAEIIMIDIDDNRLNVTKRLEQLKLLTATMKML
jgi:alcohol dehydrogenase